MEVLGWVMLINSSLFTFFGSQQECELMAHQWRERNPRTIIQCLPDPRSKPTKATPDAR